MPTTTTSSPARAILTGISTVAALATLATAAALLARGSADCATTKYHGLVLYFSLSLAALSLLLALLVAGKKGDGWLYQVVLLVTAVLAPATLVVAGFQAFVGVSGVSVSSWLGHHTSPSDWAPVATCLKKRGDTCPDDGFHGLLRPCCSDPALCGDNVGESEDPDCLVWCPDQAYLYFACVRCKLATWEVVVGQAAETTWPLLIGAAVALLATGWHTYAMMTVKYPFTTTPATAAAASAANPAQTALATVNFNYSPPPPPAVPLPPPPPLPAVPV